jgi:hypothetical protein
VAEGNGLLNRHSEQSLSGVRISPPPQFLTHFSNLREDGNRQVDPRIVSGQVISDSTSSLSKIPRDIRYEQTNPKGR